MYVYTDPTGRQMTLGHEDVIHVRMLSLDGVGRLRSAGRTVCGRCGRRTYPCALACDDHHNYTVVARTEADPGRA